MKQLFSNEYHDRGMMKWGGFILAEHQAMQDKQQQLAAISYPAKPQMTVEEVNDILQQAIKKNKKVRIQREALDEEARYYPDVIGEISGFDDLGIYVSETKVDYDEIRHVAFYQMKKWYEQKE